MPRRFELGTLVTAAKELADMENQDNVSTVTWKRFLSTQNGLLHGIVAESGLRYFEVAATFSTTTDMDAAGTVLEPNDHLSSSRALHVNMGRLMLSRRRVDVDSERTLLVYLHHADNL